MQVAVISFRYFALAAPSFLLGESNGNVAAVFDVMADGFEAGLESGDADGGRAHVDAAAGLSEIERHSDDANLARNDAAEFSGLSHSGSVACRFYCRPHDR